MGLFFDRVMESTTVEGTGDITPGGTFLGFRTFASVLTDADTFDYAIYAVDGEGAPSGDWEIGTGTWNTGVIERTDVQDSSNAGAAVNFGAGTKHVILTISSETLTAMSTPGFSMSIARLFKQGAPIAITADGTRAPVTWAASEIVTDPDNLFDDTADGFKIPAGVSYAEVTFNAGFATLPTGVPTHIAAIITHSAGGPSMASAVVEDDISSMTSPQAALSVTTGPVAVSENDTFTFQVDASSAAATVIAGPWTSISIKVW